MYPSTTRSGIVPFHKNQVLVLGDDLHTRVTSFCTRSSHFTILCVPKNRWYLKISVLLSREPVKCHNAFRDNMTNTNLVTPWIFGTSPGSSTAYPIPLKVVPTSKATTSLRREPEYGFIEDMVEVEGDEESLEDRFKSALGSVTPELVQDWLENGKGNSPFHESNLHCCNL